MMTQKKTLSRDKVKEWIRNKMHRDRWIYIHNIPHLKPENYVEFVGIIKEMIDNKEYGDEEIYIELNQDHNAIKIFETSGFNKQDIKNDNSRARRRVGSQ